MKLGIMWTLWASIFLFTADMPEWYYGELFPVYQACWPAILILAGYALIRESTYGKAFLCVVLLNLIHQFGDAVANINPSTYDNITAILNALEFIVLFGFGGITAWREHREHTGDGVNGRSGRSLGCKSTRG